MGISPKTELRRFLAEDIGKGDITSALLPKKKIKARIISREDAIVAGVKYAKEIFHMKGCNVKIIIKDGQKIRKNQKVLEISGTPQAVLSCERTALNLLTRMSGIATQTHYLTNKIPKTMKIFATRKTAPGLRFFDKEAVKIGGGEKHRMSLDEMVMIKDNHLVIAGSIEKLMRDAKQRHKKVEIEVETRKDAIHAAKLGANIILLDNFSPKRIIETVSELTKLGLRKKIKIEASGGISEKNIGKYAKTDVDMISVGTITNSVKGIDFSLEI